MSISYNICDVGKHYLKNKHSETIKFNNRNVRDVESVIKLFDNFENDIDNYEFKVNKVHMYITKSGAKKYACLHR